MCGVSAVAFVYYGKRKYRDEVFSMATQITNTYTEVHDIVAATPNVTDSLNWENNDMYESDEANDAGAMHGQCVIPSWLAASPEMIFPPSSIKTEEMLGHGQYGTVLKGKLYQGKAV